MRQPIAISPNTEFGWLPKLCLEEDVWRNDANAAPRVESELVLVAGDDVLDAPLQGTGQVLGIGRIIGNLLNGSCPWCCNGGGPHPFKKAIYLGFIPAMTFLQPRIEQDMTDFSQDRWRNNESYQ